MPKAPDVPRARTGVDGLDAMLGGGLPQRSVTLVRGGPGAGKTTLSMQFLAQGVKEGEKGLYITLEESVEEVLTNAQRWGLDTRTLTGSGMLKVYALSLTRSKEYLKTDLSTRNWLVSVQSTDKSSGFSGDFGSETLSQLIDRLVKDTGAKRLIFDSLTMFTSQFESKVDLHLETLELVRALMRNGCTTLFTAHTDAMGSHVISPEEYIAHGVLNMHFVQQGGKVLQAIQVLKMRGIEHDRELRPYRIGGSGITVYPTETILGGA